MITMTNRQNYIIIYKKNDLFAKTVSEGKYKDVEARLYE